MLRVFVCVLVCVSAVFLLFQISAQQVSVYRLVCVCVCVNIGAHSLARV